MVDAQQWLNANYPQEKRSEVKEIYINEQLEGELNLSDFTRWGLKVFISHYVDKNKMTIKNERKQENESSLFLGKKSIETIKLINAQEYINQKYPKDGVYKEKNIWGRNDKGKKREEITNLSITSSNLEGELDCSDFVNLEKLYCSNNQLTNLDLSNLLHLKNINCQNNYLTNVNYPTLNSEKLTEINISNNNFPEQNLSTFGDFTGLQTLKIGNDNKEKIEKSVYNRFLGSLEHLKNLTELKSLDISNTDINSGVEQLPNNIRKIYYSTEKRPNSKVKEVAWQLDLLNSKKQENWEELGFTLEEIKSWMSDGLTVNDYYFADYLKNKKNFNPQEIENSLGELKEEYNLTWKEIHEDFDNWQRNGWESKGFSYEQAKEWIDAGFLPKSLDFVIHLKESDINPNQYANFQSKNVQEWVEYFYPKEKRAKIRKLDISNKNLEGDLDLVDFTGLWEIDISSNPKLGEIKNKSRHATIKMTTQDWLDREYPKGTRGQITELNISSSELNKQNKSKLEGSLKLEEFNNLKKLICSGNSLTELEINSCKNLEILNCSGNQLSRLSVSGLENLTEVCCSLNKITELVIFNCSQLDKLLAVDNQIADFNFSLLPEKIKKIDIRSNNFASQDLSCFSNFDCLKELLIGTFKQWPSSQQPIYNRFHGSLKWLRDLWCLEKLDISNTEIDRGLEFLPRNLEVIYCSTDLRISKKIERIEKVLKPFPKWFAKKSWEYSFGKWRASVDHNLIKKIKGEEALLTVCKAINSALIREIQSDELNTKKKILEVIFIFYLEEEIKDSRKELYKEQVKKQESQIEIPPK